MRGRIKEIGYDSKNLQVLQDARDLPVRGGGSVYSTIYRVTNDDKEDRHDPTYHDFDQITAQLYVPAITGNPPVDQPPGIWSTAIILEPWFNFGFPSSFRLQRLVVAGNVNCPHFKYVHHGASHTWLELVTTGDQLQGLWTPYDLKPSFVALVVYPGVHLFERETRTFLDIPRPFRNDTTAFTVGALPFLSEEASRKGCRVLAFDRLPMPTWQFSGSYHLTRTVKPPIEITLPGGGLDWEPEETEHRSVQFWSIPGRSIPFHFDVSFESAPLSPRTHYLGLKKDVVPGVDPETDPTANYRIYSMTDSLHLYHVTYESRLGYIDLNGTDVAARFSLGANMKYTVKN